MAKDAIHWIRDVKQIEALSSPLRQSLLDRLEALGPSSVRELAQSLGLPHDSLYYHVKVLLRVGLVVEREVRSTAGRDEVVYDLVRRRWHLRYEPKDPKNVRAVRKVTAGILRQAERDFADGLAHPGAKVSGASRNLWSLRLEASLTQEEIRTIHHHLESILDVLREPRGGGGGGTLCALSWVFAPIREHRGRRRKRTQPAQRPRATESRS